MSETKTIKEIKEDNFEWTAEARETSIPTFEITLPDYVTPFLGLKDGDPVVFSETKDKEDNSMIITKGC